MATADWKSSRSSSNRRIKARCRESLGQFSLMSFSCLHNSSWREQFNPSEEELVFHYLKWKICGIKEKLDVIPEVDVYKCELWQLTDRSFLPQCNKQWYFFSPCVWKYRGGSVDYMLLEDHRKPPLSVKFNRRKTLSFYKRRPPCGEKTDWMMHEYYIQENEFKTGAGLQSDFVLCNVLRNYELPKEIGGLQNAEIEKCDSSAKTRNPSCSEDKSEDGFKIDSMPIGLGSNCVFGWLPSSNNYFPLIPTDISFTRLEATYAYLTGEEMDEYIEQPNIIGEILQACLDSHNSNADHSFPKDSYGDILNGDYIELNDFENCDSSLSFETEFKNVIPVGFERDFLN